MVDVIIIGGSFAGLSAAMGLGRSLKNVMVIDNNDPCNKKVAHSHNFIAHDGASPAQIALSARQQVLKYPSVSILNDTVLEARPNNTHFDVRTASGNLFTARTLIIASGVNDILPNIEGFAACWPTSIIHCPYCHGYEERGKMLAVIANGDEGFEYARLIHNWSKYLTVFTNGPATFTQLQRAKLENNNIAIIESPIASLIHHNGQVSHVTLTNGGALPVDFIFYKPAFGQKSDVPMQLGCDLTKAGHIQVNMFGETSVPGVFAIGDCASPMRSVANAVAAGNFTSAYVNKLLIEEDF
ncbi:NAD(P)/FAD-dependent oxidoreductase [Mucilaginibacter achroorhodeus]|uniref:NAD(P)/FAD-dependent oxidoreductase n=1 Tax=Mucilaginibacter achroorhodeus TaxID=2599294 RepID=A0A563U5R2_9SPHI|nr:NAD(P)/FAD-dependent oxidoreductase [Mucilaginibacter achroorhodeus]TWR26669.1 NAD(P)/FAD-dependent oxidoreductase [Mucilaginibacter achroorhodeus]